jgi:hypothetical protein
MFVWNLESAPWMSNIQSSVDAFEQW